MNFLLLRGEVVKDRPVSEIMFDSIEECDDIYSLLLERIMSKKDYGEIWYYGGGPRRNNLASNLVERWIPNFKTYKTMFKPDVVFARGAFEEYNSVLYKFSKAVSIAYGAGRRYLLQPGFTGYDIILQDSPEQVEICKKKFPKALTTLFIKPAPDNIMFSINVEKRYDICFPANSAQIFKGFDFVYSTIPKNIKLLNLGNQPNRFKHPNNVTSYRVLRTEIAKHYSKCKMGIVVVDSKIDSCPRVIPELLANGLPIVVLDTVRFWKDKYIVSGVTGELATKDNFWEIVRYVLKNLDKYESRKYYEENLSLLIAAKFLKEKINEVGF
jgi:glycosyltransferase involved in cell wall biosynthesis